MIGLLLLDEASGFGFDDWLVFAGRLHPILLHLPIGLLAGVALLELVTLFDKRALRARRALYALFGVCAVLAAVSGWLLGGEEDYLNSAVDDHRTFGIAAAGVATMAALFDLLGRGWFWGALRWFALGLCTVLFTLAGHRGGMLTHGSRFLSDTAPPWLAPHVGPPPRQRVLLDVEPAVPDTDPPPALVSEGSTPAMSPRTDLETVVTAFRERCFECHSEIKVKGGLRLDVAEEWASGVDVDDPEFSEFLYRVTLPADDGDAMPPKGDRLEPATIDALKRWIVGGAPMDDLERLLREGAEAAHAADDQVRAVGEASGASITVHPLDLGMPEESARLVASWAFADSPPTADRLAVLAPVAERIIELRLQGTSVTDEMLVALPRLPSLRTAHLERTAVGDAGALAVAERAPGLEVLNLHSTMVTKEGAASLQERFPGVRTVLFGTAARPEVLPALPLPPTDQQ